MRITAYIAGVTRIDESTADFSVNIGFILSGTRYNVQAAPLSGVGNLASATLCNTDLAEAVSDYVDTNYGTTTTGLDVTLFAGAVLPISL